MASNELNHESRITRLETVIENINSTLNRLDTDMKTGFRDVNNRLWSVFLWMMATLMTSTVGLASLIAHTQHWI